MRKVFWTDEMITEKIIQAKAAMGIDRMPTSRELEAFYGKSLVNKIARTGGMYGWAEKLGLDIKDCETFQGYTVEVQVKKILEDFGFRSELTSMRYPYDILVDGCVKIDVKSAHRTKANGSDMYSFELAKRQPTCDIYIAACLSDEQNIEKIYVIPAHVMAGKTQLSIGVHKSRYDAYIDRWDIVKAYEMAFTEIS